MNEQLRQHLLKLGLTEAKLKTKDVTLLCKREGCEKQFVFEAERADFYTFKGISTPKYCTDCRTRSAVEQKKRGKLAATIKDLTLVCQKKKCGTSFVFEGGEQAFYFEKGLTFPRHCRACRCRGSGSDTSSVNSSQLSTASASLASSEKSGLTSVSSDSRPRKHPAKSNEPLAQGGFFV